MIVGTTEAAKILQISSARLRRLLIAGRVEGAYKSGKMWLIPLLALVNKGMIRIRRSLNKITFLNIRYWNVFESKIMN